MLVKRLLLVPMLLLTAWMVMALFVVNQANVAGKVEQLTLGSIGEPDDLNPIISSTTSAAEIEGFVFNGLLKYDEDINVVGDLARSYRLTQDSTAFFASGDQAAAALEKLNAAKASWAAMKLHSVRQEGPRLILHFEDPAGIAAGTGYEEALFSILDRSEFLPVAAMTVSFDPQAEGAEGKTIRRRLRELAAGIPGVRIHEMTAIGESLLGISAVGDSARLKERLVSALEDVKAEVLNCLDQALLNEPIITFEIRPNVRWQDDQPLTAGDAAFTYACLIDPQYRSPRASDYWPVKSVSAPDDLTFVVRYRYPFSECLSSWMMSLLPRHILQGRSSQWWADHYNSRPVGTGPYRVVEWKRNEFLRLTANPGYFEGPPNLPGVVYRILPDPFVNQIAFDAREFDVNGLRPYQVKRYERDHDFRTFRRWGLGYDYVGWNLQRPLFADRRVRLALAHAVDVDRIVKYIYRGYARPANGPFPFQMWYANKDLKPFAYDPQRAREMLAEAGWRDTDGDGVLDRDGRKFEFTAITNNGNTVRAAIQMLLQDDLKKIGVKVNTASYEWAVFIKNYVDTRQYDACILGWSLGYSYDQFQIWHSSQVEPPGLNFVSYRSRQADELLQDIRTTFDRKEIARLCARLQEVIYNDQPYLFLCFSEGTTALYRGKYVVRRPDGRGGWIVEPVRNTPAGPGYYQPWWAPRRVAPQLAP